MTFVRESLGVINCWENIESALSELTLDLNQGSSMNAGSVLSTWSPSCER